MKQNMMKLAGIAAVAAVLVGCNEINFSGLLNITEPVVFSQSGKAVVTVNPGQFQTKASIGQSGSKKQIKLEIKNADNPTKVTISFDKNINVGEQFTLTAAQIGQNFDLTGTMATNVQNSPEQSGYESCTYQYPQTVCRSVRTASDEISEAALVSEIAKLDEAAVPLRSVPEASNPVPADADRGPQFNGPVPPPPHTPVCSTVWVNRPGTMFVRYYYETTNRDLAASFVQNGKTLGTYTGKASDTRTVYTYRSDCR